MTGNDPRESSARERIAALRRAQRRQRSGGRGTVIAAVVVIVALLGAIGWLLASRVGQTLSAVREEDPRARFTAPAGALAGAATPSPGTTAVADPAASATPLITPPAITLVPQPAMQVPSSGTLRDTFTILLMGVDRRADLEEGVRSDTLIIVRVDSQARTASMLSIPRDSVVEIPGLGASKINAAYSFGYNNAEALYGTGTTPEAGGGALAAQTVTGWLGITVDYVAQVDFDGFARLVDSIGGVLIDVRAPLLDAEYPTADYGYQKIYIPAGLQTLDGQTALVYARTRHASSDFDRSRRQQEVLRAVLEQVRARGILDNAALLPRWAEVIEQNIRTTLPIDDLGTLADFAALARELSPGRIQQLTISEDTAVLDATNGTELYWNAASIAELVDRWRQGPPPPAEVVAAATAEPASSALPTQPGAPAVPSATVPALPTAITGEDARIQVLNAATTDGIAGSLSALLADRGFAMGDPASYTSVYERTTIFDYTGLPATRRLLAETLGIDPRFVIVDPPPDAPPAGVGVDIVIVLGNDYGTLKLRP